MLKRILFVTIFLSVLITLSITSAGQELYVFEEPASNMPGNSLALKYSLKSAREVDNNSKYTSSRNMLEVQFGLNKKWELHPFVTLSDMYTNRTMKYESIGFYAKYRFLSLDDIHKHFRAASFIKSAFSKNKLKYDELNADGDQTALQGGVIFTQLIHKLAVSTTIGLTEVVDKSRWNKNGDFGYQSLNYSLSSGYLFFPKKYTSFNQPNFNIYCEFIGAIGIDKKVSFLDMAPALQVILNSNTKINAGYRFQLSGNAYRMANTGFLLSFERTFLNALQKRQND
jgi:hypothetical protein